MDIEHHTLHIRLLGHLSVVLDGTPLKLSLPPKALSLWAYLLLHRAAPVPRDVLSSTLWPDVPEAEGRANLRRHLHKLHKALPPASPANPWLLSDVETIQWNPEADYVLDAAEFERKSYSDPKAEPAALADAVKLYAGDLLQNLYDDWLFYERERLRNLYFADLNSLILDGRARRDYAQAILYAGQALAYDPLREDVVRHLVAARYAAGDRSGALRDYARFARRLRDELAVDPMPETVALREAIVRNTRLPDTGVEAARPDQDEPARSRLPFIGRETEIEQLAAWWNRTARGHGSLVLIGGEAGVGKTRLTAELARHVQTQGGRVLYGATTFAEPAPYQAMTEALRSALPLVAVLELDALWLSAVTPLLPDLTTRRPNLPALPSLDPERERARLFEALARCVEGLAQPRPVLLILEDLHWAGSATMAWLEFLARRAAQHTLLVVATYREEETPRTHPLRDLRRLQREKLINHLALDRLSAPAVEQYLWDKDFQI